MEDRILYYALKYDGNYDRMHRAFIDEEAYRKVKYDGLYITINHVLYPNALRDLKKPPYILFYKGDINLLNSNVIGVVGSRLALNYAISMTKRLIAKKESTTIVSGMAKGIDTVAHKAALTHKHRTIAVLGSGIDYIYPYENKDLYQHLCKSELVISEFPGTLKPKPYFFPFRNRIIAALADELYVMQANIRSGTLLTVNDALELNKDIYVLPYRLSDKEGGGCNMLIQQGANIIMEDDI